MRAGSLSFVHVHSLIHFAHRIQTNFVPQILMNHTFIHVMFIHSQICLWMRPSEIIKSSCSQPINPLQTSSLLLQMITFTTLVGGVQYRHTKGQRWKCSKICHLEHLSCLLPRVSEPVDQTGTNCKTILRKIYYRQLHWPTVNNVILQCTYCILHN